ALDVFADEAIRGDADVERDLRGVIDDRDAVLLCQGEDAEDLADPMRAAVRVEMATEDTDRRAGRRRPAEQRERGRRSARRLITDVEAMPAARGAQMLAQELAGRRIDQADVQRVPLHVEPMADPARRRAVESRLDLHAAIEMDRALAKLVIAKRLDGE